MYGVVAWSAACDEMFTMLPPAARRHERYDGAGKEIQAANVDAHRLVPLLHRRLGEECLGRRHGVVHQHVESAERGDGRVDEVRDVGGVADVAANGERGPARVGDLGNGRRGSCPASHRLRRDTARRAHDLRAEPGQADRQSFSDSSRRTGHDDHATGEVDAVGHLTAFNGQW
jgi:hypothetical protein